MSRRGNKGTVEKPKDFKNALIRLTKELKKFYVLIIISVLLSSTASVISIFTPNKLSTITNYISDGLGVNNDNLNKLINDIQTNYSNGIIHDIKIDGIIITTKDQLKVMELMSNIDKDDSEAMLLMYEKLPASVQSILKVKINTSKIKEIALLLLFLYVISALFNYLESIIMTKVSNGFAHDLRNGITKKINRLPLKYFDKNQVGDILSRVANDVDTLSSSMNNSISTLISSITLLIGTIVMMFITNYILAITAIVSSLLGFIFMTFILKRSQKYFDKKQQDLGKVNGNIEEIFSGLNVVKTYNGKKQVTDEFNSLNNKLYESNWKSGFLGGLMPPLMNFVGDFGYLAVCVVGALMTYNGYISFGTIIAFIMYVRLFTSPLTQIGSAMSNVQQASAASERVFSFMDEEEMPNDDNMPMKINKDHVKGNIEFKNVQFKYAGSDHLTIKDFSAKVKPGQKIAIVGPTGAGKTTMVNLLMKFYDVTSGDILINGVSIHELSRENVHDLFTMVLQDTWMFDGTIRDNIKYNNLNVSDEDIERVCRIVGLDYFIKTLPDGYDTVLLDNDSISAGQKQLLTIARGMLKDAPFLILDEATSNVDTRTEELVQKAMDELTKGRTSFIIAHRLSTIKNADLILVMQKGNIIEQGTHDELMKQKGFYAELYNSQFEL